MSPLGRLLLSLVALTSLVIPIEEPAFASSQSNPVVFERAIITFVVEADGSSREIMSSSDRITSELGASEYGEAYFNYSTSRSNVSIRSRPSCNFFLFRSADCRSLCCLERYSPG